ncbi:ashwin-like [Topomyia yanbarensis]|uniref:ashwin-like n=1 Tax=Topomyia yanbarensis TaxID=2498891 RepID=UPI00273CA9EF|nr:ashwin-like [Topomyia yanbarensis]
MDILHPYMLSKDQLLEIFRQRNFLIPRLDELSRDELIGLYVRHLLPQPRRGETPSSSSSTSIGTNGSTQSPDVEMKDVGQSRKSSTARQRIVFSDQSPQSVDNVSNGMKRIKLINATDCGRMDGRTDPSRSSQNTNISTKRTLEVSPSKAGNSTSNGGIKLNPASNKRQKITWP